MAARGRRYCTFIVAIAFVTVGACGRQLPPDEGGPGAPEAGTADASGAAPDASGPDAAEPRADAGYDGDASDGAPNGPCKDPAATCNLDEECCNPSKNRCILGVCRPCSTYGQACNGDDDCCTTGPKLTCSTGSCCRATGEPCMQMLDGLECCLGCSALGTCN